MLKRLLYALALCIALFAPTAPLAASQDDPAKVEQTKDCTVYATRTGHRYHRAGCRYLRQSRIAMSRSEALARGLTPCLVCGGSDCER